MADTSSKATNDGLFFLHIREDTMIAIYLRLQIDSNQRRRFCMGVWVSFDARVTCILYRLYLEVISQFKTENPQRSSLFLSPMRLGNSLC